MPEEFYCYHDDCNSFIYVYLNAFRAHYGHRTLFNLFHLYSVDNCLMSILTQSWTNVEDVGGPTLYKCYTNVLRLLGAAGQITKNNVHV